jgi:hypothetical protein
MLHAVTYLIPIVVFEASLMDICDSILALLDIVYVCCKLI